MGIVCEYKCELMARLRWFACVGQSMWVLGQVESRACG